MFIDPDDYISENTVSSLDNIILNNPEFDILIMGFNRIKEDAVGNIIRTEQVIPHEQYKTESNEEVIRYVLPKYLGYSVDNLLELGHGVTLSSQIEFGSVYRNLYNRDFLVKNRLYFNENIVLNEDGMFNSNCMAHATHIVTSNDCLYYYVVRPTGAFNKNRGPALITNKLHLLEERYRIITYLNDIGFVNSIRDFAGSNVMSVLELMAKCSWKDRKRLYTYVKHPLVQKSISLMPWTKIKKVDFLVLFLKLRLINVLFLLIIFAQKLGVKTKI